MAKRPKSVAPPPPASANKDARRIALELQLLELERRAASNFETQQQLYRQMSALRYKLHTL